MWKYLVYLLAIVAVLHAIEMKIGSLGDAKVMQNDDGQVDEDNQQLNQDVNFSDDLLGSKQSMTTNSVEFVEDEPADLGELTEDQFSENASAVDGQNSPMEEEQKNTKKREEVRKPVLRGWRIRRRRRRRRITPPPPTIRQCGSVRYNIKTHSCCFNRFVRKKGKCPVFHCTHLRPPKSSVTYNPFTHRCCHGKLMPRKTRCPVYRCGAHSYNPRFQKCCRHRLYNFHTHKCCHGIPIPKCYQCRRWATCGWRLYSTWLYRCCAGRYIYSLHFQRCCHGSVIDKQALCLRSTWLTLIG